MAKCAVCLSKGSDLTVVIDLGGSQQALFAERRPHLSTDDKLCTLCVLPRTVPFLCENITKNNIACNTSIPINRCCHSCQENKINGAKTAWSPEKCCKECDCGPLRCKKGQVWVVQQSPLQEHPHMAPLCTYIKYMCSLVHGSWSTSRRQRYIECVGKVLPDYTDTTSQPQTKSWFCGVPPN